MMPNAQFYLVIGLPILAVISSLVVSLVQLSGIRAEISDVRADLRDIKLLTGKVYEMMGQRP